MGCGSNGGSCGCAEAKTSQEAPALARINGVPLHAPGERPDDETLRQRACTELLRQRAQLGGLLGGEDQPTGDGVSSAAATAAIEALLESELRVPDPDDEACRRHFEANAKRYAQGERVLARHILFAVTPGVDVKALRERAEGVLVEVRADTEKFAERARTLSNCPSGQSGGELGWLSTDDCAPEFARELFGLPDVGVLPRLVHSRFGLHVVEVMAREPGQVPGFEQVQAARWRRRCSSRPSRRPCASTWRSLPAARCVDGVELDAADSPLVQ